MNKRLTVILTVSALIATSALLYFNLNKSSDTDSGTPSKTCTTYGGYVDEQCAEDYIGLTKDAALARAEEHKYRPKVVSIDGISQPVTDEAGYIIYLDINNGVVTDAYFLDGRNDR